jgi:hypothetical protein
MISTRSFKRTVVNVLLGIYLGSVILFVNAINIGLGFTPLEYIISNLTLFDITLASVQLLVAGILIWMSTSKEPDGLGMIVLAGLSLIFFTIVISWYTDFPSLLELLGLKYTN